MNEDLPQPSLLLELEDAVLKIEAAGWDEQTIFSLVNMILKGYVTNGQFSEIYLAAAAAALQHQQQAMTRTVDEPPQIIIARS